MTAPDDVVVLLDCDNTLLDNDRVQADLSVLPGMRRGERSRGE